MRQFKCDIGGGLCVMGESCFPLVLFRDVDDDNEGDTYFNRIPVRGIGLHTSEWTKFCSRAEYIMRKIEEHENHL